MFFLQDHLFPLEKRIAAAEREVPVPSTFSAAAPVAGHATYLKNNANQPIATFVDDPLNGLPYLVTRISRHPIELVVQAFVDQLVQALAKDV